MSTVEPPVAARILLVEDHPNLARLLSLTLRAAGFEVQTADSVSAALALAEKHKFQLLISDMGLPDGTGVELLGALRARCDIKGIAYSGFGDDEHVQASLAAGFTEHLSKPVEPDQLEAAVRRVLRQA